MSELSFHQIEGLELTEALLRTGIAIIAASEVADGQVAYFSAHGEPTSYLFGKRVDDTFCGFRVEGGTKADRAELLNRTKERMQEEEGGVFDSYSL